MNIHKCNEAARWKAEVLQMMWAGAKDHVAGARAQARQRTLPPWDTICPGCHPLWRCHPFGCHQQQLHATPSHPMPPPWDIIFPICHAFGGATLFGGVTLFRCHQQPSDATPSHWMPPAWDAICPRCHPLWSVTPFGCHPHAKLAPRASPPCRVCPPRRGVPWAGAGCWGSPPGTPPS